MCTKVAFRFSPGCPRTVEKVLDWFGKNGEFRGEDNLGSFLKKTVFEAVPARASIRRISA
jgi:hypothetical protein